MPEKNIVRRPTGWFVRLKKSDIGPYNTRELARDARKAHYASLREGTVDQINGTVEEYRGADRD